MKYINDQKAPIEKYFNFVISTQVTGTLNVAQNGALPPNFGNKSLPTRFQNTTFLKYLIFKLKDRPNLVVTAVKKT